MTVKELREQLANLPDNAPIFVYDFGEGGAVEANELIEEQDGYALVYSRNAPEVS